MTSNAFILLLSSATTSLVPERATANIISVGQSKRVYRSVDSRKKTSVEKNLFAVLPKEAFAESFPVCIGSCGCIFDRFRVFFFSTLTAPCTRLNDR